MSSVAAAGLVARATRVDGSQRSFKDVSGNQVIVRGTPALAAAARTSLSLVTLFARR